MSRYSKNLEYDIRELETPWSSAYAFPELSKAGVAIPAFPRSSFRKPLRSGFLSKEAVMTLTFGDLSRDGKVGERWKCLRLDKLFPMMHADDAAIVERSGIDLVGGGKWEVIC